MTSISSERSVVCLLARAPSAPGKTRLVADMPSDRAHQLRRALLLDTYGSACDAGFPVVLCYTPPAARDEFEDITAFASAAPVHVGRPFMGRRLMPQVDGDLGTRMLAAFDDMFALGFDRVVLIGSDLPTLPPEHLVDAMAALDRAPVVLGPADDGGYYLVGLRERHPELFDGITWGSADVLTQTLARAARAGVAVEPVPAWHDVDTPDDLRQVSSCSRARHTRGWLETMQR